jgi:2-polyprenyl-3-methyl-5-hydroxy-6-metoxy-1,4-benzoquinol methylase
MDEAMTETGMARKAEILSDLIACPHCHGDLKKTSTDYTCLRCQQRYPVVDEIPRFLPALSEDEQQVKRSFHLEQGRYLDSRHLHFRPELVEQWLQDVKLPAQFFKGKVVLDAGCGSGRWTYAMAQLGATVVAVDFTDSGVQVTHQATRDMDHVAVLQGSIFSLPFKPERFDVIVSWGVLHHTPDTKAAFDRLVPFVKKGGQLYVMVYEKHNALKFFITDLLRRFLRLFGEADRYRICKAFVIQNRLLFRLLKNYVICSLRTRADDLLEISSLQLGLYDAYSPKFNHLHTRDEVSGWFREHGFEDIQLTKPVKYTSRRDVRLQGECGGSVNIRGIRR